MQYGEFDERTKDAHDRIQCEMYLLGPMIALGFLIYKLIVQMDILMLLSELTVFAVFAVFCVLCVRVYRQSRCLDERTQGQITRLARTFYKIQMLAFIPAVMAGTAVIVYRVNHVEAYRFSFFDMPMVSMLSIILVANIYGMLRMRNEKFVSSRAAALPLNRYRNRLLKICLPITAGLLAFLLVWAVLNFAFSAYADEEWHTGLVAMTQISVMLSIIGLPTVWLSFFHYYGMRKDLAKKENETEQID